jgi:hypothetical protein
MLNNNGDFETQVVEMILVDGEKRYALLEEFHQAANPPIVGTSSPPSVPPLMLSIEMRDYVMENGQPIQDVYCCKFEAT